MLGKAKSYLATHKTVDIALLVTVSLLATSKWLNLEIPKAPDAVANCRPSAIMEFTTSPLRTATNVISGVTALLVCSTGLFLLLKRWRQKRTARNNLYNAEASREPQS
jgi:hypothetical protein